MSEADVRSREWIRAMEDLVRRADAMTDAEAKRVTVDLVQAVMQLHAAGLERVLEIVAASCPDGQAVIDNIAADEVAGSILLLHGLHPDDLETRVRRAVGKLRLHLSPRGADVTLLSVEEGVVRLRCSVPPNWSGGPLRDAVEEEIYAAAPEMTDLVIEGIREVSVPNFVPLAALAGESA